MIKGEKRIHMIYLFALFPTCKAGYAIEINLSSKFHRKMGIRIWVSVLHTHNLTAVVHKFKNILSELQVIEKYSFCFRNGECLDSVTAISTCWIPGTKVMGD